MPQERRKIAILYTYNENWIGSTYYIQNLISALNNIPDEQKPDILVVAKSKEEFDKLARVSGYPYLRFTKMTLAQRIVNNFTAPALWKNFIGRSIWSMYKGVDLLFPAINGGAFAACRHRLYWVADFQEHYLPEFFSAQEIKKRKSLQAGIVKHGKYIVLSSQSALDDFNEIYPGNNLKAYVLPFAVTHPGIPREGQQAIKEKYNIKGDYFICSNQFWKHKNHIVVLKAISVLKKKGKNVFVAFTGKIHDYRNPQYFDELNSLAKELDIQGNISFLGFISREDQLSLMENAAAVIQPSLFEGWSTVVEDVKSLRAKIVVSDISVHKEQLVSYSGKFFFDPRNEMQLAECMEAALASKEPVNYDYQLNILNYGKAFSAIIDDIIKK